VDSCRSSRLERTKQDAIRNLRMDANLPMGVWPRTSDIVHAGNLGSMGHAIKATNGLCGSSHRGSSDRWTRYGIC
jgi:hypothetical protein